LFHRQRGAKKEEKGIELSLRRNKYVVQCVLERRDVRQEVSLSPAEGQHQWGAPVEIHQG
jgi:hypothetical protein